MHGRAAAGAGCGPVVPGCPGRSAYALARLLSRAPVIAPVTRAPISSHGAPGPARGGGGPCDWSSLGSPLPCGPGRVSQRPLTRPAALTACWPAMPIGAAG